MTLRGGPIESSSAASTIPGWSPKDFHRLLTTFFTAGIVESYGGKLAVSEKGAGANMSVDVASGLALIEVTTTLLATNETLKTWLYSDAVENVLIAAADATNPRKDRIVAKFDMTTDPNGAAANIVSIEAVTGTPAASPSAPSTPSNAISLAIVDIPAGDTSIENAQITDDRSYVESNSAVLKDVTRQGLGNTIGTAGGTGDVVTVTLDPTISAYAERIYGFVATNSNTGATTLNIDGVGAKSVVKYDGTALAANDIRANDFVLVAYESSNDRFRLLSLPGNIPSDSTLNVQNKTADYTVTAEDAGSVLTNSGAADEVIFTLPSAAAGLNYDFQVMASQELVIQASSGDSIKHSITESGDGWKNASPYSRMRIWAMDAATWVAEVVGTWDEHFLAGFWFGGSTSNTKINKFDFANETESEPTETLATGGGGIAGVSDEDEKGFLMGRSSYGNTISALDYFTDLEANIAATLDTGRHAGCGVHDGSGDKGYMMGGNSGSGTYKDHIDNMDFSAETSAKITATISLEIGWGAPCVDEDTAGYQFGGQGNAPGYRAEIQKLTYSGETSSVISAALDSTTSSPGGVYGSSKGDCMGGSNGSGVRNTIDDLVFSGETSARLVATLGTAKNGLEGVSGASKGYVSGGSASATAIDDMDYDADTSATVTATLTTGRDQVGGCQMS